MMPANAYSCNESLGYFLNAEPLPLAWIRNEPDTGSWWQRIVHGGTAIYRYTANPDSPLTLVLADGTQYRPSDSFETDMGSVPLWLQGLPGGFLQKDRYIHGYLLHDDGYGHGGLWVKRPGEVEWRFQAMPRSEIDTLLDTTTQIDGASKWWADRIYWAVSTFGGTVWTNREPVRQVAQATRDANTEAIA